MLVVTTPDLHGSEPHYRALAELLCVAQPRLLVLAGDLLRPVSASELQRRATLQDELQALAWLSPPSRTIYVLHGTNLDLTIQRALRAG
jgi:predicted phosphodiesterase